MVLWVLFVRDVKLYWCSHHTGMTVIFFFMITTFLPFGLGADMLLLREIASSFIWIGLTMSVILSLEQIFQSDIEDGSFDQFMMSDYALEILVFVKALAHWVAVVLPLICVTPLIGLLLNYPLQNMVSMMFVLCVASPALSFLGIMGAAFVSMIERGGLLSALLVMPLYVPIFIFGHACLIRGVSDKIYGVEFVILLLMSLTSFCLSPVVTAAALRVGLR